MKLFAPLLLLSAGIATALAKIDAIQVPESVKLGEAFKVTYKTVSYIQPVEEYHLVSGLKIATSKTPKEDWLGTVIDKGTVLTPFPKVKGNTFDVTITLDKEKFKEFAGKKVSLTTAVFATVGASGTTWTRYLHADLEVKAN